MNVLLDYIILLCALSTGVCFIAMLVCNVVAAKNLLCQGKDRALRIHPARWRWWVGFLISWLLLMVTAWIRY